MASSILAILRSIGDVVARLFKWRETSEEEREGAMKAERKRDREMNKKRDRVRDRWKKGAPSRFGKDDD